MAKVRMLIDLTVDVPEADELDEEQMKDVARAVAESLNDSLGDPLTADEIGREIVMVKAQALIALPE